MAFVLHAEVGNTASSKNANQVRMTVDPTVLPPVLPPGDETVKPKANADEPVAQEIELPDIENTTPLPKPPGKPATKKQKEKAEAKAKAEAAKGKAAKEQKTKAAPKQKAQAKKTATQQPKPKAKPAPAPTKTAEKPAKTPAPKAAAPKVQPGQEFTPAPVKALPGKDAVTGIQIDSGKDSFVLIIDCNRPVGDTTYINLTNPRRLVVDLREKWLLKTKYVHRSKGGMVEKVVAGVHKDRLRLVIYFNTPPKSNLTPEFVRSGNKLFVSAKLP